MSTAQELSAELKFNGKGTRELLSRIPSSELGWKPHEKSMTLGRLGMHLAELLDWIVAVIHTDGIDFAKDGFSRVQPDSTDQILAKFDDAFPKAIAALAEATDEQLAAIWTLRSGETIYFSRPRLQVLRTEFGHQIHHRGQLTVYLRMKDVPLPGLFGPTADTLAAQKK